MGKDSNFASFRTAVGDLKAAWQDRLDDTIALRAAGRHPTAICHALYALEILLKYKICERLDLDSLPKAFEIHDLEGLLVLAGLRKRLDAPTNLLIRRNWEEVNSTAVQLNELRFGPNSAVSLAELDALLHSLTDPVAGVITWISNQS